MRVDSFTADGKIIDVRRTVTGHDAIRAWADGEVIGDTLRVLSADRRRADGQRPPAHRAPAGSAGSAGGRAHHDFSVSGGKISGADLQRAQPAPDGCGLRHVQIVPPSVTPSG
ncbi:hypothetical protein [Streptosporangium sp. LJ11]|uniref:hypothetical protein n=1 Tax=Streptosporangium sp. LJ11 TaxID=3436927 RepID=UPI003F78C2E5